MQVQQVPSSRSRLLGRALVQHIRSLQLALSIRNRLLGQVLVQHIRSQQLELQVLRNHNRHRHELSTTNRILRHRHKEQHRIRRAMRLDRSPCSHCK